MSWFVLLLVPVGAILYLLLPLLRPDREIWDVPEARIESLQEKKRMLVGAVRDIDFEHSIGNLTDEDHLEARERLKADLSGVVVDLKIAEETD